MNTNARYRKHDGRFATSQPLNIGYGIGWLILFFILILVGYIFGNSQKALISPLVIGPMPVYAKEPEVFISCENPKGYLECQVNQHKITWKQYDRMYKIIQCESAWNPDAYHVNTNGSVDLGLVQINSIHKDISNADKLDFKKSIDWMIKKIKKDGGFSAWSCNNKIK